jgi:hypothetical protein
VSKRIDRWAKPLTGTARAKLVVQLDPPDSGDAWFLSVLGPGAEGTLLPIEQALADGKATKPLADELNRVERIFPALLRPGALRRGQVYLSQDEAWELMTEIGPQLELAGFEVRAPALSRRKPSPSLRLFTEADRRDRGGRQPAGQRALVGAVRRRRAHRRSTSPAWPPRPDRSSAPTWQVGRARRGRPQGGRRRARRAGRQDEDDRAEILRHSVGLEGNHLAGGVSVAGSGWATDLLAKASEIPTDPVTEPEGFVGELRSYQAEAVAWLRFLHTVELGGCLALDMGLGKTPTMLAHLARNGPARPGSRRRW